MAGNTKKKRGLGRGLGSLISAKPVPVRVGGEAVSVGSLQSKEEPIDTTPAQAKSDKVVRLPGAIESSSGASDSTTDSIVQFVSLNAVAPNPEQPRKHFEEEEVQELVRSIKNHGVLQPILVRPVGGNLKELQIVAGERRYRAATRAKLAQIPVIIRDIDDRECLEISLVENVQRASLTPLEEARGYQELISRFQLTQAEVAEKVGKERASVANMVRLLKLPDEVQARLEKGELTVGHAKAILTVKEPKLQVALAGKVIKESLSVRDLEKIVSRKVNLKSKSATQAASGRVKPKYREIVDQLRNELGTKIKIQESGKNKGKLLIDFYSFEELERIAEKICFRD